MHQERSFKEKLILFFKGIIMGAANKVPGVSGGTVSFVLGFYEELIYSFQKVNFKALKLILNGRFKSFFKYTNSQFISIIIGGSIFSYFTVSLLLDFLLKNYELYVWSWFFGLIIGSIYYIAKDFGEWNLRKIVFVTIGIVIGLGISFLSPAKQNDNLWFIFICGIIGVSGMTLPGLSGSFILILLGNYVLLLVDSVNVLSSVIRDVFSYNFGFLKDPFKIYYLKIIGVFTAGSAFGLVTLSHILGYVLKRWYQVVTAVIIGFITGSLGIVWPWKEKIFKIENHQLVLDQNGNQVIENYQRYVPDLSDSTTWFAIFYIIMGISLILVIDFYGRKIK